MTLVRGALQTSPAFRPPAAAPQPGSVRPPGSDFPPRPGGPPLQFRPPAQYPPPQQQPPPYGQLHAPPQGMHHLQAPPAGAGHVPPSYGGLPPPPQVTALLASAPSYAGMQACAHTACRCACDLTATLSKCLNLEPFSLGALCMAVFPYGDAWISGMQQAAGGFPGAPMMGQLPRPAAHDPGGVFYPTAHLCICSALSAVTLLHIVFALQHSDLEAESIRALSELAHAASLLAGD